MSYLNQALLKFSFVALGCLAGLTACQQSEDQSNNQTVHKADLKPTFTIVSIKKPIQGSVDNAVPLFTKMINADTNPLIKFNSSSQVQPIASATIMPAAQPAASATIMPAAQPAASATIMPAAQPAASSAPQPAVINKTTTSVKPEGDYLFVIDASEAQLNANGKLSATLSIPVNKITQVSQLSMSHKSIPHYYSGQDAQTIWINAPQITFAGSQAILSCGQIKPHFVKIISESLVNNELVFNLKTYPLFQGSLHLSQIVLNMKGTN